MVVYVCKFCKIQCHKDLSPVVGRQHKKSCPRRRIKG